MSNSNHSSTDKAELDAKIERRRYEDFVESLVFLDSAEEIREAIRQTEAVDLALLAQVIDDRAAALAQAGLDAEHSLVEYVRELLQPLLDPEPEVRRDGPIESFEDLRQALSACNSALQMRALCKAHRRLLTRDNMEVLLAYVGEPKLAVDERWARIEQAFVAPIVAGDPASLAMAYLTRGAFYLKVSQVSKAQRVLARGRALSEEIDDPMVKLGALGSLGGYYRELGDLPRAVEIFEQILEEEVDDLEALYIVSIREAIASCCQQMGQYLKALDAYGQAIDTLERFLVDNPIREVYEKRIRLLRMRGLAQDFLGRHHRAAIDYESALGAAEHIGDRGTQFMLMNDIAATHQKRGQARAAVRAYRRILNTVDGWGNPVLVASARNNLGNMLLLDGQPAAALAEFRKALPHKLNRGDQGELITLRGMADALGRLGDDEAAKTWRTMALMPALESGDSGMVIDAMSDDFMQEGREEKDRLASMKNNLEMARAGGDRVRELMMASRLASEYVQEGMRDDALQLYEQTVLPELNADAVGIQQLDMEVAYARLLAEDVATRDDGLRRLQILLGLVTDEIDHALLDERRSEITGHARPVYDALMELLGDGEPATGGPSATARHSAFEVHESAKARSFLSLVANAPLEAPRNAPADLVEREKMLLDEERRLQGGSELSEVVRAEKLQRISGELDACWAAMKPYAPAYVRLRTGRPMFYRELKAAIDEHVDEHAMVLSL